METGHQVAGSIRHDAPMTNTTITEPTDPTHTGAELVADPRPALESALATCSALVDAITPDQLDLPTPCEGMDVRALLGHLVMVAKRIGCAARMAPTHEWPSDVTGLADDAWAPVWHESADAALADWSDDALLERHMVLPWAAMSGREVVGIYTNEVVVHTWDLGQALGVAPIWSDAALEVADAAIHSQLPDADRGPMWAEVQAQLPEGVPWEDPFVNAVPVADDATLIDRVIAWNGRRPRA
jgi:uncharacterized protein (TIGR03086 family)